MRTEHKGSNANRKSHRVHTACTQQNTLTTKRQPARKKVEKKNVHDTKMSKFDFRAWHVAQIPLNTIVFFLSFTHHLDLPRPQTRHQAPPHSSYTGMPVAHAGASYYDPCHFPPPRKSKARRPPKFANHARSHTPPRCNRINSPIFPAPALPAAKKSVTPRPHPTFETVHQKI